MSPTIFYEGPYRFFFFSREEARLHVHVTCADGEAKFWIEPVVALASFTGLNKRQLLELQKIVVKHEQEIKESWRKHFKS